MDCIITSKKVRIGSNEELNQRMYNYIKSNEVSNGIPKKEAILTAKINAQFGDFLNFIVNNYKDNEKYKKISDLLSVEQKENNFENVDLEKFFSIVNNANQVKKMLKDWYNETNKGINSQVAGTLQSELFGFTGVTALGQAIEYTGTIINIIAWKLSHVPKSRFNRKELFKYLKSTFNKDFNVIFNELCDELIKNGNKKATEIINYRNNLIQANESYKQRINKINVLIANETDEEKIKSYKEEIKKLNEENIHNETILNAYKINIVNKYGNSVQKNQCNLVSIINSYDISKENAVLTVKFIDRVLNSRRCLAVHNRLENEWEAFKETLYSGELDDEDIDIIDADENEWEMYKNWDDKGLKSFTEVLDDDIRTYFNSLFKCSVPLNNQTSGEVNLYYSKQNECGVPIPYTHEFVLQQLMTKGNYDSIEDFIESVKQMANEIPELYGFAKMYKDMKENINFARHIFVICDYAVTTKSMITIDNNGISNNISNSAIHAISVEINRMFNGIRTNYLKIKSDNHVKELNDINKQIKDIIKSNKRKTNETNKLIEKFTNKVIDKILLLNPTVDVNSIRNYIDKNTNENVNTKLNNKLQNISDIANQLITIYNSCENIYITLANNKQLNKFGILNINSELVNTDNLNNGVINLCKIINKYNAGLAELNSKNAENNLSADPIKNNFLTRLIRQLEGKGVNKLLEKVKQCPQYKYSLIYTGLKIGNTEIPGIFKYDNNGELVVNPEGIKYIKNIYFNGIKTANGEKSVLYDNMTGGDYYITSIINYFSPLIDANEENIDKNKCVCSFLQTPSDAQKNFIFRLPRFPFKDLITLDVSIEDRQAYINEQKKNIKEDNKLKEIEDRYTYNNSYKNDLYYDMFIKNKLNIKLNNKSPMFAAIKKTVIGEIESIYNQLGNLLQRDENGKFVIKNGKYIFKKDFTGLIENVHIKRKDDGKVEIVDKNGKLVGNWFKFNKLFTIDEYNASEDLLNAFLYGELNMIGNDGIRQNNLFIVDNNNEIHFNNIEENTAILNNIIEKFVNNYAKYIIKKSLDFRLINDSLDKTFSLEKLIEANFGNILSNYIMCDLAFGDNKFYKDGFTFLKRASEVQKGGNSYAGFDFGNSMIEKGKDILDENGNPIEVKINGHKIKVAGENLKLKTAFNAITVYNSKQGAKYVNDMYKELVDINTKEAEKKGKITPEIKKNIEERAYKIVEPFGYKIDGKEPNLTKVNDAQSYISFEEFIRRRILDGTIDNYKELISTILDIREGKKTIDDLDISKFNALIQVQKNFYYDLKYDPNLKLDCPRQIKNAEFVIVPELVKGTELEKVWQLMNEFDIAQINTDETSKVTQKNIITLWNNDGVLTEKNLNKAKELIKTADYVEEYEYKYLYKQQEIVSHMKNKDNKVGIQMVKKIIDNAGPEVKKDIDKLFEYYCANIKSSYHQLIHSLGWKFDKNDKIVDKNGNDINLSFNEFYRKARREAQRLGKNSQFMEYLTPILDEFNIESDPVMPNWMNLVSDKIISIAQAIFTKSITRQVLPGFHAVQVSGIGIGVDENGVRRELKYHPTETDENGTVRKAYAEIMVPRWWLKQRGIRDNITIEELQAEGLDYMIGYRIPTEGKQSISIFKVVGFLDDTYDSTILVPNEWVIQTGSDMDIDTIYTVTYKPEFDEFGRISMPHVINYDGAKENVLQQGYIDYVLDNISLQEHKTVSDIIKEIRADKIEQDKIKELLKDLPSVTELRNELYEYLKNIQDKDLQKELFKDSSNARAQNTVDDKVNLKETFVLLRSTLTKYGFTIKLTNEQESIVNTVKNKVDYILSVYNKYNKERNRLTYFKGVNKFAEDNNVISYNQWLNLSNVDKQTKVRRDKVILDTLISIMENTASREENYSRSNFDDLSASMKKCDELRGSTNVNRSAYNPLDQIDFMVQAQAGRVLKAFSVTRDTFASVCNHMKAELSTNHQIRVRYNKDKYNLKEIENSYDVEGNVVIHNKLGWSKNNLNVVGKLITPYTSQTTAHILDVMKAGSIYNENMFTFGTFKTLIDCGVDYDTAIAFLMQPSITEINKVYNANASIYINSQVDASKVGIKNLANKLGVVYYEGKNMKYIDEFTPMNKVYEAIDNYIKNVKSKEFVELFPEFKDINISDFKSETARFILDGDKLLERLSKKEDNISEEDKLFDLCIALEFDKIHDTTLNIENLTRVSNPDKFGAKQTIKDTKAVLNNIDKYRYNPEKQDKQSIIGSTLKVNGKFFVDALYPLDEDGNINVEQSGYPYLAAYLKYSTIPSVIINSELFKLEKILLSKNVTDKIQQLFGKTLTTKQYDMFKKHVINYLYHISGNIMFPLTVSLNEDNFGEVIVDVERKNRYNEFNKNSFDRQDTETLRILGKLDSELNTFKPTVNEDGTINVEQSIKDFNELSPADKVLYIQSYLANSDMGLFSHLNVSKFYDKNGNFNVIINFNDQIENIEQLIIDFQKAYGYIGKRFEDLIYRLTCIDLVKYAFISEGFKFKQRAITKIIPNNVLYNGNEANGMGIVDDLKFEFDNLPYYLDFNGIYESFIRSNPTVAKELNLSSLTKKGYTISTWSGGAYVANNIVNKDIIEQIKIRFNDEIPQYIRIRNKTNNSRLYKVINVPLIENENEFNLVFIPMPTLLESEVAVNRAEIGKIKHEENIDEENNDIGMYTSKNVTESESINYYLYETLIQDYAQQNNQQGFIEAFNELSANKQLKIGTVKTDNVSSGYELENAIKNDKDIIKQTNAKALKEKLEDLIRYANGDKSIKDIIGSSTKFNIKHFIPHNDFLGIQKVNINGTEYKFNITRFDKKVKGVDPDTIKVEIIENKEEINQENEQDDVINNMNEETIDIRNAGSEDISYDKINQETDPNVLNDADTLEIKTNESIKVLSILGEHLYKQKISDNTYLSNFRKFIDTHSIKFDNISDLAKNKEKLYTTIAKIFSYQSKELLYRLQNIEIVDEDGNILKFDIKNKELYKYLTIPENYIKVVKLILEAKNFGKFIKESIKYLSDNNSNIQNAIDTINESIINVLNSKELKEGFVNIFEEYFAKYLSTNPNIKRNLIELRTAFRDAGTLDSYLTDIAELDNKQIQTIVKYVYGILDEARTIIAPKVKRKFLEEYDNIVKEGVDMTKIIDSKTGKLILDFTDKFITDRNDIIRQTSIARREMQQAFNDFYDGKITEEEYINISKKFYNKLHERNKFLLDYTNQEIIDEYYDEEYRLEDYIMKNAYDEYITYRRLRNRLSQFSNKEGELTNEEKSEILDIKNKLYVMTHPGSQLTEEDIAKKLSGQMSAQEIKYHEELNKKAEILKKYLDDQKELNRKYFNYEAIDGWEETLEQYLNIIKDFDKKHVGLSIEEKLKFDDYKQAYEWILLNTRYVRNDKVWQQIYEKDKILNETEATSKANIISSTIAKFININEARDRNGLIDGRKFTNEQLETIKRLTEKHYTRQYDNLGQVIKATNLNKTIFTKEFYDILTDNISKDSKKVAERLDIVHKINALLLKGIDNKTGNLDTVLLIKELTTDELYELKTLISNLHDIKKITKRTKKQIDTFKNAVNFATDEITYEKDKENAKKLFGENSEKYNYWIDIFTDIDEEGNVPSDLFYGYIIPKDEKYIDKEKTEAIDFLNKNVEYVPNHYYYEAAHEASLKDIDEPGYYQQWFNLNHAYNPVKKQFEPLRIWTERRINPTSELLKDENGNNLEEFNYEANFDNKVKNIREEFKNNRYNQNSFNYKHNPLSKYNTNIDRNDAEKKMFDLLLNTMKHYAKNKSAIKFIEQGFLPRQTKMTADAKMYANQALGLIGLEIPKDTDDSWTELEYNTDKEIETDMFNLLKAKGYKHLETLPERKNYGTTPEEEKRFKEDYDRILQLNDEIKKHNLELDAKIRNEDWREVFATLIESGEDAAAREKIKHSTFLLLEDLISNIEDGGNYTYEKNNKTGRLIRKTKQSPVTLEEDYRREPQSNNIKVLKNWMHRVIYNEYKKPHKLNTISKLAQNITSAKYMMLNLTGGIANVTTGLTNIMGESYARQFFTHAQFIKAQHEYFSNCLSYIADFFADDMKSSNKTLALIKMFDVVDYEKMFERFDSDNVIEGIKKTREMLYSLQSMGEHYMQNTAALAMLHSHRVFLNNDKRWQIGSFADYTWNIEQLALLRTIDNMNTSDENKIAFKEIYYNFVKEIKNNKNELIKYDNFRRDVNTDFIRKYCKKDIIEFSKAYNNNRKELLKHAEEDFNQYTTVYDSIEFKDGICDIDKNSNMTGEMLGQFRRKMIKVNDKIHGVYSKYGAARIESEWWGNLVMQYHKHFYPGILKRWRINGYYNEVRGNIEKGSIISLYDFLTLEFRDFKDNVKNRTENDNTTKALASLQEIFKATINTVAHVNTNWAVMPEWEKANMRRLLGDLSGIIGCMCLAIALYCFTDDDDIKDSETLSIMLYCADRCFSEADMYFPWGLKSEFKTLWSSPVAMTNAPEDLIGVLEVLYNTLTDDDFNPYYTTGQYKGEHKAVVRIKRNIPIYRIYNRLSRMTKNNSYYRLGQTGITSTARNIADKINPDK